MTEKATINSWVYSFCEGPDDLYSVLTGSGINLQKQLTPGLGEIDIPGILIIKDTENRVFDFLEEFSREGLTRILVICISNRLGNSEVWRLLNSGASDVLQWDQEGSPAEVVLSKIERWGTVDRLIKSSLLQNNLVGKSRQWITALRKIVELSYFTDASALVTGESGTGKELVARLIHTLDQRPSKKNFVVLDCTTIVPGLSGSEFFGHEKGAFTGAVSAREGAFARADGGSLFLDEIGELPPALQAELLRVIQEQAYKRVGGNTWMSTRFRLICATNKNLIFEQSRGNFRSDLYYRIACWTCRLPSLRERKEDILPLARHFISQFCQGKEPPEIDDSVCDYLLRREYAGNVRDLKQLIWRIMSCHVGPGAITAGDIPEDERPPVENIQTNWNYGVFDDAIRKALTVGVGLKEIGRVAENTAIRIAVGEEGGNLQRAARKLGVTDRALQIRRASRRFDNTF